MQYTIENNKGLPFSNSLFDCGIQAVTHMCNRLRLPSQCSLITSFNSWVEVGVPLSVNTKWGFITWDQKKGIKIERNKTSDDLNAWKSFCPNRHFSSFPILSQPSLFRESKAFIIKRNYKQRPSYYWENFAIFHLLLCKCSNISQN